VAALSRKAAEPRLRPSQRDGVALPGK